MAERTTPLLDKARRCFADDRFATALSGIKIVDVGATGVKCAMPLRADLLNARGSVMGGALFTLADFAFAVAANLDCVAEDRELDWVSIDSCIHFLAGASKGCLTATTHCVKQGRTTCLFRTDIRDDSERLIATVETTGLRTA